VGFTGRSLKTQQHEPISVDLGIQNSVDIPGRSGVAGQVVPSSPRAMGAWTARIRAGLLTETP
jgi:hypothetical protein